MAMIAMALPILPGKKEEWQKFLDAGFNGPGRAETVRVRDELGVHERSFLQKKLGKDDGINA